MSLHAHTLKNVQIHLWLFWIFWKQKKLTFIQMGGAVVWWAYSSCINQIETIYGHFFCIVSTSIKQMVLISTQRDVQCPFLSDTLTVSNLDQYYRRSLLYRQENLSTLVSDYLSWNSWEQFMVGVEKYSTVVFYLSLILKHQNNS